MFLIILLLMITIILVVVTIAVLSVGGAIGIIVFGDVIVCILILGFIIKNIMSLLSFREIYNSYYRRE